MWGTWNTDMKLFLDSESLLSSFTCLNAHQILNNKTFWKVYNNEPLQLVGHFSTACIGYEIALVKLVCDLGVK